MTATASGMPKFTAFFIQTLAAIESRMDELVSQNAALESKIAESTAAAAAQKPDMEVLRLRRY